MNSTSNRGDLGNSVHDLARRTNCTEFDHDLWEMVFTHASYRNEFHPEDHAAERLVGIVQNVGKAALRAAIYEFCLDQKGMDPAETSRYSQSKDFFLSSLHDEFDLSSLCRIGIGQLKSGSNRALQMEFAEKLLGVILVSSSYGNVRQFIWERLNLSASHYPRYPDGDAKSWLLEYSQYFYGTKRPEYELLSAIGPEHRKVFHSRVILPDKRTAEGTGFSRKAAEQAAAAKIIDNLALLSQLRATSNKRAVQEPPCLNIPTTRVDRFLLASTTRISQKLRYTEIDRNHLAVALTLPASQRGHVETNSRHKLLGDALENLAFFLFAFQALPTRALGSSNSAHFVATICSNAQHARLFDDLGLAPIVSHEPTVQLWEQGKADVMKAIAAAAYLTTRDFEVFFGWLKAQLSTWCQESFSLLADNPLALKDPKSFLQELLQGQGVYRAEYLDAHSGPAHRQVFTSQLYLVLNDRSVMKVRLATGTSGNLRDAQKAAAANGIEQLIPRNTAGRLAPISETFWRTYLDRVTNSSGVIVGACGVEHFKNLNSFAAFSA